MRITGTMVHYFSACKRELWFFTHGINLDFEDENIEIGRLIHEKTYSDEKKDILINGVISLDFVEGSNGKPKVFEIKKSSKLEEPVKNQVKYYLWYLEHKIGLKTEGIIVYPKEKKREQITLTEEDKEKIRGILTEIPKIVNKKTPPEPVKKPYCKRCSYYELCWC